MQSSTFPETLYKAMQWIELLTDETFQQRLQKHKYNAVNESNKLH